MNTHRKTAIIVGILFITATVTGILFVVFTGPILDTPDYLAKLAASEKQVVIGALVQFTMAAACAGIAIGLYPVLKVHNQALALGSVGFRVIEAMLFMLSAIGLLSLLTLGQEYVKTGAPNADYFQTLGTFGLAIRAWSSTGLGAIAFCLGALMYYTVFYQSGLIPRWLSGWGFIAAAMHLVAAILVIFDQEPSLIFDAVGKTSHSRCKGLLKKNGVFLTTNGLAKIQAEDLIYLKDLIEKKKLRPVIDRTYTLEQIVEAHRYVDTGHKKGNVVITVAYDDR